MRVLAMLEIKETKSTNIIWTDLVFLQLTLVYTRHAFIWNIIITLILSLSFLLCYFCY